MVSLSAIAVEILNTGDAEKKVKRTFEAEALWEAGEISSVGVCTVPDVPAAPIGVEMVDPWKVARRKGGSEAKRIAALHSLCHIEQVAVNLSWDIIARFSEKEDLPKQFYDEWVRIAAEEAKHYTILAKRLKELGSYYGALPAHNGLWSSATETSDSLASRLAIVHMVHEARGLDVHPSTVKRFHDAGDSESVKLLEEVIFPDEVTHVEAGVRWFKYLHREDDDDEIIARFHQIVRKNFRGNLKPPFHHEAREKAGFTREWYEPLTVDEVVQFRFRPGQSAAAEEVGTVVQIQMSK